MAKKHVLLVEPDYYTQFPPLGLLKLSTFYKNQGSTTELIRGTKDCSREPDLIYITSLFTWSWEPVWKAVRFYSTSFPSSDLWLGGLYASLMPEHAALSGVHTDHVFKGIFPEAENLRPDYSLVPEWNQKEKASILFSSRGCIRNCGFCAVPQLEGKIVTNSSQISDLLYPEHTKIILFDNNFLASSKWESTLEEIKSLDLRVDFNQGLDARLITPLVAKKLAKVKIDKVIRLSYDNCQTGTNVEKAIKLLKSEGINGKSILVYTLFNFTDDPQDFFERMKDVLKWGAVCYPMRYEPLRTLFKNKYVSSKWTANELEAIQRARRVIGFGGAFAPHKGMLNVKVENCNTFEKAFKEFMNPEAKIEE
ncbi:MAG: hypothetical protein ABSF44_09535 [Candidatus Bathyarchaeia archaeon]